MFEGAQGTLLDIDHGTYPVRDLVERARSAASAPASACRRARSAACSAWPRPTPRASARGRCRPSSPARWATACARAARSTAPSTGRPRRCGWFDAVAVRYAARINGLDALALTKLDVLDGLEEIQICTGYRRAGQVIRGFPADLQLLADCEPVYEVDAGLGPADEGRAALRAICRRRRATTSQRLEEVSGVPAAIISTGSERDDTILREDSVLDRWFGAVRG